MQNSDVESLQMDVWPCGYMFAAMLGCFQRCIISLKAMLHWQVAMMQLFCGAVCMFDHSRTADFCVLRPHDSCVDCKLVFLIEAVALWALGALCLRLAMYECYWTNSSWRAPCALVRLTVMGWSFQLCDVGK